VRLCQNGERYVVEGGFVRAWVARSRGRRRAAMRFRPAMGGDERSGINWKTYSVPRKRNDNWHSGRCQSASGVGCVDPRSDLKRRRRARPQDPRRRLSKELARARYRAKSRREPPKTCIYVEMRQARQREGGGRSGLRARREGGAVGRGEGGW
jgi:hypothetical protein